MTWSKWLVPTAGSLRRPTKTGSARWPGFRRRCRRGSPERPKSRYQSARFAGGRTGWLEGAKERQHRVVELGRRVQVRHVPGIVDDHLPGARDLGGQVVRGAKERSVAGADDYKRRHRDRGQRL